MPDSTAVANDPTTANLATVTTIYEAFGRGDVATILDTIAADCRWEAWERNSAQRAGVPWLAECHGPAGVGEFFARAATFDIHDFQVLDMLGSERQVAVQVLIDATVPGGGRLRDEELHLYTLDAQHQVVAMRHYLDTAKHIAAARGEDTTSD